MSDPSLHTDPADPIGPSMDAGAPSLSGPSGWGAGLFLALVLAVVYADIMRGLVQDWWNNDNYTHGFVVPIFSAWLVWQQRERLQNLSSRGSGLGLGLLIGGLLGLVFGEIAAEEFLMRNSLIVVIAGLIVFHLGVPVLRALLFPLAFLFFMVPLPATLFQAIALPLQGLAAQNATWSLDTLGVPVLRDGNIIHLSQLSLGVTEACSGIRSLMTLLALAVAWAYVSLSNRWAMLVLVATAIPITIIANAGRVILTGLIGQWFGLEYAQGFFHSFSGWIIFVVAFACLWGVQGLIEMAIGDHNACDESDEAHETAEEVL